MREYLVAKLPTWLTTDADQAEDTAQQFANMEGIPFGVYVLIDTILPDPQEKKMKYQVYAQRAGTPLYAIGWPDKATLPFASDSMDAAITRCNEVYEGYMQVSSIENFALSAVQFTVRDEAGNVMHTAGNI